MLGLIAATGLRLGEAIGLERAGTDLDAGLLTIVSAKSGRDRLVPLHPTVTRALAGYARRRDQLCPDPATTRFFVSSVGTRVHERLIDQAFAQLTSTLGMRAAGRQPRIHDLRHTFAVRQLLAWHRDGADVNAKMPLLSAYLGHVSPAGTYWYLTAVPELMELAAARLDPRRAAVTALAPTVQAFFTSRLTGQRGASGNTVAAYRDTWRLLLAYASQHTGKHPSRLDIADLSAPLIAAFLDYLEHDRGNSPRTRNQRLTAIRSLFTWAALRHPEHAADITRVLAITPKRYQRNLVTYLTAAETEALLDACDTSTWTGRRDHAMIMLAAQAGLRVSELAGLTTADVHLGPGRKRPHRRQRTKRTPHPAAARHRRHPAGLAHRTERPAQ